MANPSSSVTNTPTGSGYPYPNTLTLEFSWYPVDNNRHHIDWHVWASGGASTAWQNVFNGLAGYKQSGMPNWNWLWGPSASGQPWGGSWLASGGFDFWHTDAANLDFIIGGGYNSTSSYTENQTSITLPALYGNPAVPTAQNLASDGTPHKAYSKVINNGWGANQGRGWFEIWNSGVVKAFNNTQDNPSMYWTLPSGSSNVNACTVHAWHGRAIANHELRYADSATKYIATPSAPKLTISAGSDTSPSTTINGNISYKGGDQNSSTCDNGTIKKWQLAKMVSTTSGVPGTFQHDIESTSKTCAYTWQKNEFEAGKNYKFYTRVINTLGGTATTTSDIIYCPTGVSGTLASKTTKTLTFRGGYNYAGDVNTASAGTISCYQLDWGDSADNLNHTVGPQTSDTFTVSNLLPNQTVYYRITAWNVYGLSNVSNVNSATTIPRYDPAVSSINIFPQCPGADVEINVAHTGGLTEDELSVTSLKAEWKPVNSTTWTTLAELTGLDISAGQTYTMENLISGDAPEEGDYQIRITASNGTDTSESIWALTAPTNIVLTSVALVPNQPIQIRATATMSGELSPYKYTFRTEGGAGTRIRTFENTDTSITVTSPNYLLYDTEYTVTSRVYNQMGLWRQSAPRTARTDKRVHWYVVTPSKTSEGNMTFATKNSTGTLAERPVVDVCYIVANALGDITSARVGENMNNKRLRFISETLHYRPENVASITFTNGKKLAYDLDASADIFKFGIWDGNTIETTFFDGISWLTSSYDFPNGYTISTVSATSGNLNHSAAFSTTSFTEIPLPERGGN